MLARLADVERWIVTHHDPMHDDDFLQDKLNLTRQLLNELGGGANDDKRPLVLVVDDFDLLRDVCVSVLEAYDVCTMTASNGASSGHPW